MTLQELKESCVSRYNEVKEKAVSFVDKTAAPKVREVAARLGVAIVPAITKRAATAKLFIEIDENDNIKISIEGKKKDLAAALNKILGEQL